MTIQEIKEMLDSTINSNGKGEITAKTLNLALHAILNYVEEKNPEGSQEIIDIDSELNDSSLNPVTNAAITSKFTKLETDIKSVNETNTQQTSQINSLGNNISTMKSEFVHRDEFIKISTANPDTIRTAFEKVDISKYEGKPTSCFFQNGNSNSPYVLATMIIEGFDSSLRYDGTEQYKINIIVNSGTSKIKDESIEDETVYIPSKTWSPNLWAAGGVCTSVLYNPTTKIVQILGSGNYSVIPKHKIISPVINKESLDISTTYYVHQYNKDTYKHEHTMTLVWMENTDGTYNWYNIKDGQCTPLE